MFFSGKRSILLLITLITAAACGQPDLEAMIDPTDGGATAFSLSGQNGSIGQFSIHGGLSANRTMKVGTVQVSIWSQYADRNCFSETPCGLLNSAKQPIIEGIFVHFGRKTFTVQGEELASEINGDGRWLYIEKDTAETFGDDGYSTIEDNSVFEVQVTVVTDERLREHEDRLEVGIELGDILVRNDADTLWVVDSTFYSDRNPNLTMILDIPAPAVH